MNIDNLPIIEGFDAVKESRQWKREVWLELQAMTREERRASSKQLLDWYEVEREAFLKREAALASA